MLKLSLRPIDVWDDENEEYITIGGVEVELEHSLYTVSLWEQKHKKPFASLKGLERKELLDYISNMMCQTPNIPSTAWLTLTQEDVVKIQEYLNDPGCATKVYHFGAGANGGKKETMSAELIYFYMAQFNIPLEFEHWHLNRLMTLIDVAAVKNSPPRKMGKREAAMEHARLNEMRRAQHSGRK